MSDQVPYRASPSERMRNGVIANDSATEMTNATDPTVAAWDTDGSGRRLRTGGGAGTAVALKVFSPEGPC